MVLRGVLSRRRSSLQLFRASARLTGFANQLSSVLQELEGEQAGAEQLRGLAVKLSGSPTLSGKLNDFAVILEDYQTWLADKGLCDIGGLIPAATRLLSPPNAHDNVLPLNLRSIQIEKIWVDGFLEIGGQELELLAALLPFSAQATLTFGLDQPASGKLSWLSTWAAPQQFYERCRRRLSEVPSIGIVNDLCGATEGGPTRGKVGRFDSAPAVRRLAHELADLDTTLSQCKEASSPSQAVRLLSCSSPIIEVSEAARTILRFVRDEGRFRDVAVLVRRLDQYGAEVQRLFSRYGIPFFLDKREYVAHHPLAELTRSALRTVAFQWQSQDWFSALKTGLLGVSDGDIDRLETDALANGWTGNAWLKPITVKNRDAAYNGWLAEMHAKLTPPFSNLAVRLKGQAHRVNGLELAAAIRELWTALAVERQLEEWSAASVGLNEEFAPAVHGSVWTQMESLLQNLELGFPDEHLTIREWLPIIEAGLSGLSVGIIPPALDQVLVGEIDRSRNPDVKVAVVLGLNEGVFPAAREPAVLLTDSEREALATKGLELSSNAKPRLSRERYLFYLACTRASKQLVISHSLNDAEGTPINPSPFLSTLKQIFPELATERAKEEREIADTEHPSELLGAALIADAEAEQAEDSTAEQKELTSGWNEVLAISRLSLAVEQMRGLRQLGLPESLESTLGVKLYGKTLISSVSKLEQFAACPFKFFVHSGLRAEERREFELDAREQGSFQHDVLAEFHRQLQDEHKLWRDISPVEARERVNRIGQQILKAYRDGLLEATEESRFLGNVMVSSLQDFVETLVGWMHSQYQFNPVAVELPFEAGKETAPWKLSLGNGLSLALQGRIDRIDLFVPPGAKEGLCVVVDYKSSQKKLEDVLMANGLQLQLLAYLRVLQRAFDAEAIFGVKRVVPAGVFYVNLRGRYEREHNRLDALGGTEEARKLAYRHSGRFSMEALALLDARPDWPEGDQFNYRRKNGGGLHAGSREALPQEALEKLLDSVEENLKRMGREVFAGAMGISPYKKGSMTACVQCSYEAICRVDPYTQTFRILSVPKKASSDTASVIAQP
jgi:ATP-dependent helicase/nuclease subunit B